MMLRSNVSVFGRWHYSLASIVSNHEEMEIYRLHDIQGVFLPNAYCSWDRLCIPHGPDQRKAFTEDLKQV